MAGDDLTAPSPEELRTMLKLCGSKEALIAFLAKKKGLPQATIAPAVLAWLSELELGPPPSRQRSAPPVLMPAFLSTRNRPAGLAAVKAPPCSAPMQSAGEMMAAMRAIDSRLNRSTQASYSGRKASAAPRAQRLDVNPPLHLLPPAVPPLDNAAHPALLQAHRPDALHDEVHRIDMDSLLRGDALEQKMQKGADDQALKAYMERHACVHGGCAIAVGAPGKRSHGWNYR